MNLTAGLQCNLLQAVGCGKRYDETAIQKNLQYNLLSIGHRAQDEFMIQKMWNVSYYDLLAIGYEMRL